jgi:hypothetical protein
MSVNRRNEISVTPNQPDAKENAFGSRMDKKNTQHYAESSSPLKEIVL